MTTDMRTALLDAAQARFAEHGYAGTSVRDLAADVGIKESSLYHHFAGKQALLDAVLDRAEERVAATAAHLGAPLADVDLAAARYREIDLDSLERIALGFLDLWLTDPCLVAARRILTLEQYRTPAAGRRLRSLLVEEPLAFQTALFARLVADGGFRPADPAAIALAFWGPVLAILTVADAGADAALARQRLTAHLAHFRATHVQEHP